jgi:tetratricopeptide (TPR) repeat protein
LEPPGRHYVQAVKKISMLLVRWLYVLAVAIAAGFLISHSSQRTSWFKEHLYRRLVSGGPTQKLQAAGLLAQVGGEQQLLRALRLEDETVRQPARRALEHSWFASAGTTAFQSMEAAYQAAEDRQYDEALKLLDEIVAKYPNYAEAWNRRGAVLWQLGNYKKALDDCQRAVALNPNHYGAWQGLGVCYVQLGDFLEAVRSLRTALRIDPFDETARRCLEKCEDLLRLSPAGGKAPASAELL